MYIYSLLLVLGTNRRDIRTPDSGVSERARELSEGIGSRSFISIRNNGSNSNRKRHNVNNT